jgi:hypothetical protein
LVRGASAPSLTSGVRATRDKLLARGVEPRSDDRPARPLLQVQLAASLPIAALDGRRRGVSAATSTRDVLREAMQASDLDTRAAGSARRHEVGPACRDTNLIAGTQRQQLERGATAAARITRSFDLAGAATPLSPPVPDAPAAGRGSLRVVGEGRQARIATRRGGRPS